ncbi:MAG: hypothetical protein J6A41_05550 [Ruminiclostridium sp.]|nr:hypothetical protein [Ruminiclostridium sp.]
MAEGFEPEHRRRGQILRSAACGRKSEQNLAQRSENQAISADFSGTARGRTKIPFSAPAKSTCEDKCFFVWRRDLNPSTEGAGKFCEALPAAEKASRIWRSGRKNRASATVFPGTASGRTKIPLSAPAKSTCENKCFFVCAEGFEPERCVFDFFSTICYNHFKTELWEKYYEKNI